MVGNDLVGDSIEVVKQGIRVSEFGEISPFERSYSDIGGIPKGIEPGDPLNMALLNQAQAVPQNFARVLVAAAFDECIDHCRLPVGQDDIARGHPVTSKQK